MEGLTADLIPQPSTTTGTTGSNFNYPSDVTYVSDASVYTGSFVPDCHALYLLLVDRIELPCRHWRTGRGGEGGCSPPKVWATQIFWAARGNLGKASF